MRRSKRGFTLIEVSLFLAISGLLFVGIAVGVQNSVYQQRKNDSVQSFIEFLRGVYDEVLNVQNDAATGGRSNQAIYGRLVVFGEGTDLAGAQVDSNEIFTYSVVGEIKEIESASAKDMLVNLKANVVKDGGKTFAGFASSYEPKWSAEIETGDREPFKGMLLIVRHPNSGVVNTYYANAKNGVEEINEKVGENGNGEVNIFDNYDYRNDENVDFCVDTDPGNINALRSDVRIVKNARNSSGVELVADEDGGNVCNKK